MTERRRADRMSATVSVLRAFTESPDGTLLKGFARDTSNCGVGISGPTTGLTVGGTVTVWLAYNDIGRAVGAGYRCEVKHVDEGADFFGVELKSRPWVVAQNHGRSV